MPNKLERFKKRQQILKNKSSQSKLCDANLVNELLSQPKESTRVEQTKKELHNHYSIDWSTISVSEAEVDAFMDQFDSKEAAVESIVGPAFLSLIDGTMRAFKIGTKQGLTATRVFGECQTFSYEEPAPEGIAVDRYTEHLIEKDNIKSLASKTHYKSGTLFRDGEASIHMRDQNKMSRYKTMHFSGEEIAQDEYSPNSTIYIKQEVAQQNAPGESEKDRLNKSAETDHIIPCAKVCEELGGNKGLNPSDIKEILNDTGNLAVTSRRINNDKNDKFCNNFAENSKLDLTDTEKATLLSKGQEARSVINNKTNKTVTKNIVSNKKVQQRLGKDAAQAAGHRAVGDTLLLFMKPLYFELSDCVINGIERGISASGFKDALKKRMARMYGYIKNAASNLLDGGLFDFFKSFFSMLIEGILNCFVGFFKQLARAVSEGLRVLMQIGPILADKSKSILEKGDAILKLIGASAVALSGIAIESALNNFGIPEPWSIILSSVLATVLTTLVMYGLDKMDLFGLKRKIRRARIAEALDLMKSESEEALKNILSPGWQLTER